eukprot:505756-Prymnesium_polylepis.2
MVPRARRSVGRHFVATAAPPASPPRGLCARGARSRARTSRSMLPASTARCLEMRSSTLPYSVVYRWSGCSSPSEWTSLSFFSVRSMRRRPCGRAGRQGGPSGEGSRRGADGRDGDRAQREEHRPGSDAGPSRTSESGWLRVR